MMIGTDLESSDRTDQTAEDNSDSDSTTLVVYDVR